MNNCIMSSVLINMFCRKNKRTLIELRSQRKLEKSSLYLMSVLLTLNSIITILSEGRMGKPWRENEAEVELGILHISHCLLVQCQGRSLVSQLGYLVGSFVVPFKALPSGPLWSWLHFLLNRPRAICRRSDHIPFPGFNYLWVMASQLLFLWLW